MSAGTSAVNHGAFRSVVDDFRRAELQPTGAMHRPGNNKHSGASWASSGEMRLRHGSSEAGYSGQALGLFASVSSPAGLTIVAPETRLGEVNGMIKANSSSSVTTENSCSSSAPTSEDIGNHLHSTTTRTRTRSATTPSSRAGSNGNTLSNADFSTGSVLLSPRPTPYASPPLSLSTVDGAPSANTSRNAVAGPTRPNSTPRKPSLSNSVGPGSPGSPGSLPVNEGPSTSSWNNSGDQESEYVVDPVNGNTYYKGQFLGKGGFGRVYLLTDAASGNQYACKIIPKNRMQKIHLQKIAREIMIHKKLTHVNVVQMYHYFEDNLNAYMLLEACPRKSLMHVLKYRGRVTEPEARYYMKQMVDGVMYIHSQKVVHRDLKPGNMFLSEHMIVKIGDFGLATSPDGQRRRVTICGTPNYIAPEVLYKQAYSYEADVWALGCILYALLVGQPPFESSQLKETYARICNNQYKEVDDSIATQNGQDLIHWLLQPSPKLRPSLDRVKEHDYLTKEYVPVALPHTCCYQMPPPHVIIPPTASQVSHAEGLTHSVSAMTIQKSSVKDVKVNWLAKKLPKLPRFKHRLSAILCPSNKKGDIVMQSTQMHKAMEICLAEIACACTAKNPPTVDDVMPLFVTKWIDYSNKYGLGFQLSDKSVGVLFNDSTKMSYTHDRRRVEYMTTDDEITRYNREKDVSVPLQKKLALLRYFTRYMDDYLTEGGEVREPCESRQTRATCVPRMKRWLRTDKAIVMELTIPLLQVNFFRDHTKMVVSQESQGKGYLVTYIDASRQATSYWLKDLCEFGCTADLYERLHYVCKVSREFAEMDQNMTP
ncbi:serine/threonine-protein kinase PLK1 [Neodiprion lecontei]|uniref:Serine/threonine-protein kinase PLK n=1 Tax=Neodiprion lecontei TaxID=441921 RepID=A0A6J0B7Q6_NEOLC|nr:serine/threonine-protein kinase PLK1 [Neodiprion lecontei]